MALLPGQLARAATRAGSPASHAAKPLATATPHVAVHEYGDKAGGPVRVLPNARLLPAAAPEADALAGSPGIARHRHTNDLQALQPAGLHPPDDPLAGLPLRAWLIWTLLLLAVTGVALIATIVALRRRGRHLARATRTLRVCMAFDAALFEGMPEPVYLCDGAARLIGCNTAYERFLGTCRDQLLGKPLNPPEGRPGAIPADVASAIRQEDQQLLASRQPIRRGHSWHTGEREIRVRHWARPLLAADGGVAGLMGGFVDVSPAMDGTHDAEPPHGQRNDGEADARAQPSTLAMIGHEIRTPLQALIGILDMLLRQYGVRGSARRHLATAHGAARALLALLDDMLRMSRAGATRLEIHPEPVDVGALLWESVRMYRPMATGKGLQLNAHIAPMPQRHLADPARLRQIVANLIGNAIKFSERGEIGITLERRDEGGHGDRLRLIVRDHGVGIPRAELPRLFEPFFRATTARGIPGTGIGLPMSRQLARRMGGDLDVDSEPGVGTVATLTLVLPRHAEAPCARATPRVRRRRAPRAAGYRVMVIDDHDVCRLLLARQLGYLGHEAVFAHHGAQALALAQSRRADLDALVIDCNMPVLDGFEAVRRWRALERQHQWPRKPVIGYTADPNPQVKIRAKEAGMDACLVKPVDIEKLGKLLVRLVSGSTRSGSSAAAAVAAVPAVTLAHRRDRLRDLLQSANANDLRALEDAIPAADWNAFGAALHRIQGVARMGACERVSRCCDALEAALRRHDAAALATGVAQLSDALHAWTDAPCPAQGAGR